MNTFNTNSSQGPDEVVLRKAFRLSAPSPELKARAMKAAHEAWRATPAPRQGVARWWYPILELAAAGIILLVGSQINGFLISSDSSPGDLAGRGGSVHGAIEDLDISGRVHFRG